LRHFDLIHQFAVSCLGAGNRTRARFALEVVSMRTDVVSAAPIRLTARIAAALVVAAAALTPGFAAEAISVVLDQARIAKVPDHTTTIVVGNPLIADISIQAGGTMVVTGKGYGVTNLIALDRTGKVLAEQLVRVESPGDSVIVYRGVGRESYSCSPNCERRITLGDAPEFFDATLAETGSRNARAQQSQTGGGAVR
jgi:Flp pilus assembly secretin CpaC